MSAFWNKNKDKQTKQDSSDKVVEAKKNSKTDGKIKKLVTKKEKKADKAKKAKKKRVIPREKAELVNRTLIQPKISEAALSGQEIGKYAFIVGNDSNKTQVKEAVESMYGVNVKKVNLIRYKSKKRNFRGLKGRNSGFKKAIVTVAKGESIDLFSTKQ